MCRERGLDPIAVRRMNLLTPDQFPYTTPVGLVYDVGNYQATLDKLIDLGNLAGFEARAAESKARGKLRGLGLSTWIEACGIAPSNLVGVLGARVGLFEAATVRVNATGNISVMTGAHSHGQGHETVFAQVVSDQLGIPASSIEIVHGDTSKIPFGMGSYGSRSLAVGGAAIVRAVDKIIAKGKKIAAHMLEAAEGDIEFADGKFSVAGTDKAKTFGEIAFSAYVPHNYPLDSLEPGLEETAFYDPANFTYPAGAYACEVELDPETGKVTICSFAAADDFVAVGLFTLLKEMAHLDIKKARDLRQGSNGRGDVVVFDLGNQRWRKPGFIGDILQGQLALFAQGFDFLTDIEVHVDPCLRSNIKLFCSRFV